MSLISFVFLLAVSALEECDERAWGASGSWLDLRPYCTSLSDTQK